ncbi:MULTISPECIES: hypothetical protein [unclassified Streptomyces]|uniref:hypothetical protein n=1 Tax=unclassified Streptomyces TaxID=2593676 RepID=UPI00036DB4E3|nr:MULTISPECIES: hypothetical protein [unclassified Streptomyces]MYT29285.1 hypothetical protein [Streptomyces sp. SID8354]
MNPRTPRGRLRDALLRVGEGRQVPEPDLRTAVEIALSELAQAMLGERSRVSLVTLGSEDHTWGRNLGLRLADYDVGLPDLLWAADESDLPTQVRESCPALGQNEWEAALLVCKLIFTALESEPEPVPDEATRHPHRLPRPARAVVRERFCQSLIAIAERSELPQDELTTQLRTTLLDFASETPDNQEAAQHVAVLPIEQPQPAMRICLSPSGSSLAQVLLSADGCPVPDCVLDEFPDLNQDEWNAVIQVSGLALLAFEAEPACTTG